MDAAAALRSNDVDRALENLTAQIRSDPSNPKLRVFLFQLLSVIGNWDRAKTQLDTVAGLDSGTMLLARVYGGAIACEAERREIFSGAAKPTIFGQPEEWLAQLLEALRLQAGKQYDAAQTLRDAAFDGAPTVSGTIDGKAFDWIADADSRFGPCLEAVINGRYFWVPFHRIQRLVLDAPTDLRDQVWMPAHFTWTNGGEIPGFIPTRYPGTESQADGALRLARKTEWREVAPEQFEGLGQRLFTTGEDDHPIMDIREIVLDHPEPEAAQADG